MKTKTLPGTCIDAENFSHGFASIVCDLAPENCGLLTERDRLQAALDQWHPEHPGRLRLRFGTMLSTHL
ncbi:hypothetical protein [Caballeronia calidae]|uniref:hypothetical protein n=1 Tax=Caballeronia calidae TaxID=1777139 RepID=UPI000940DB13|nr:hypothetical protein [Caballeronia calidae]